MSCFTSAAWQSAAGSARGRTAGCAAVACPLEAPGAPAGVGNRWLWTCWGPACRPGTALGFTERGHWRPHLFVTRKPSISRHLRPAMSELSFTSASPSPLISTRPRSQCMQRPVRLKRPDNMLTSQSSGTPEMRSSRSDTQVPHCGSCCVRSGAMAMGARTCGGASGGRGRNVPGGTAGARARGATGPGGSGRPRASASRSLVGDEAGTSATGAAAAMSCEQSHALSSALWPICAKRSCTSSLM
mmetsp:Transcript_6211/g.16911  ORF Transcript_6211/g.16911 Transcript_6211/m.16911 type:complete len:244 (-) Transcript_6211:288-1019(-)